MNEKASSGEEVIENIWVREKDNVNRACVDVRAMHACTLPKWEVLEYLASAKYALDHAADMEGGRMNASGIAMFVGAVIALFNEGYRGAGNGKEMSIEQLMGVAHMLTGKWPDEYTAGKAKYIIETGKFE